MKTFFVKLTLLLFICYLGSCKMNPEGDFRGWDEYGQYLNDTYKINTDTIGDSFMYAIGINEGCVCTQLNLNFVKDSCSEIKERLKLILVGSEPDYNNQVLINNLKELGYVMIADSQATIFKYAIGFGKPIFLHFKNGERVYGKNVNDLDLGIVKKYIDKVND